MVPTVVTCLLWIWVMQPETGIINRLLGYIGITEFWLAPAPDSRKPAFILMMMDRCVCNHHLSCRTSGYSGILYESASIDGASFLRQTISIRHTIASFTILCSSGNLDYRCIPVVCREPYIYHLEEAQIIPQCFMPLSVPECFTYFKDGICIGPGHEYFWYWPLAVYPFYSRYSSSGESD